MSDDIVTLKSKEGESFEVPAAAAELSSLVRDSIHDDTDVDAVEVMRVGSTCLGKVVEFLRHYQEEPMEDIPTPLGASNFREIVKQEWYQTFVEREEREALFDLLTAANYMGIKQLLDLTCLKVTFELAGKNAEEIRQILNLPQLTKEEERKARQDHKWIFEDA